MGDIAFLPAVFCFAGRLYRIRRRAAIADDPIAGNRSATRARDGAEGQQHRLFLG
jgi:hypothetical protein